MASKKSKNKGSDQPDGEGTEKAPSSGGILPKLLMAVAIGIVSFGTVYLLPRPETESHEVPDVATSDHETADQEFHLDVETAYLDLNPFAISLQNNNRILKIGITLEVVSGEEDYIDPGDPKLRDAFTGYMRSLRLEQIEDAAFMAQMRAQLLRRAQLILGEDKIRGILITDFLVR